MGHEKLEEFWEYKRHTGQKLSGFVAVPVPCSIDVLNLMGFFKVFQKYGV